jgi:hypothetical protein
VCSGNTTSAAEMSSRDQMEDDLDHMLRFLCGVCRGNLDRDFMALERSSPCISLRVSGDRCRIVRGLISWDVKTQCHLLFPDADQGTAEEPRRSCVAPHLTCLKRLHPVFLASSNFPFHEHQIVLPPNRMSRCARNRPPLSCYHARQAVA